MTVLDSVDKRLLFRVSEEGPPPDEEPPPGEGKLPLRELLIGGGIALGVLGIVLAVKK